MAKILSFITRVLSLSTFIPLISCLSANDTSLEARIVYGTWSSMIIQTTFYAAPDSFTPQGSCQQGVANNFGSATIAHPGCPWNGGYRGIYAGGDGTYGNPVTAASFFKSPNSPVPQCGVFYSPFLKKWLIYEDDCPACVGSPGKAHFDIWIGGNGGGAGHSYNDPYICQCEALLTPNSDGAKQEASCMYYDFKGPIDTAYLRVNTEPLWDGKNCNWGDPDWSYSGNNQNLNNVCF